MGGTVILLTIILGSILYLPFSQNMKYLLYLLGSFGFIGGMDDALKLFRKKNEGLTSLQKFIIQIVIAVIFSILLVQSDFAVLGLSHPIALGVLATFVVVASANAANLTDGLDGLAGGLLGIAFLCFAYLILGHHPELGNWLFLWSGAILGFLWFNLFPARWFMGDVGSLALGAGLGGVALLTNNILPLILIAFPFIAETVSVIIQVGYFKITRKRIFRMSPLHHHFELGGMTEVQVVQRFWAVGLFCNCDNVQITWEVQLSWGWDGAAYPQYERFPKWGKTSLSLN